MNIREIILEILLAIEKGEEYSHLLIRAVLDKYNYLENRDKAFIKRVTEGTIERQITLDYILNQYSKTPVKKMKPLIRVLLRMSVYQIFYMESVADFAVCDEAVKLAGKKGFYNLKGFVNGVLRTIVRQKEELVIPEELSIRYSMPQWIVNLFCEEHGEEIAKRILEGLLEIHPVTIRVRDAKWKPEEELQAERHPYLDYAYRLGKTEALSDREDFSRGTFTVQDVSSMLVCEAVGFDGSERVLDVCAAPGGKSMHAADLVPEGSVCSRDVSEYKTGFILENIERLGIRNVTVQTWDATVFDETAKEQYDVVLADVPCSGLGVMGKKRDIKYHVTPESVKEIVALQKTIMDNVWQYVKPGGILVYSTCTIHKAENEQMIEYLTEHYPLVAESLDAYLPVCLHSETTKAGYLQLLPGIHACDGFFLARLRRK